MNNILMVILLIMFSLALPASTTQAMHNPVPIEDTAGTAQSVKLEKLFQRYWAFEMKENPFSATSSGEYAYNDQVPQVRPEDYVRRTQKRKAFLAELDRFDGRGLSKEDRLSADLLRFILKHDIALAKHNGWRIPFLADAGFHMNIGYVVGVTPFGGAKDYHDYNRRLAALPEFLDQNVSNMRAALDSGFTQPAEIMPKIMPSFESQVTDSAETHPLYKPYLAMSGNLTDEEKRSLQAEAKTIIENEVIPAYARVLSFMRDEYQLKAVKQVGALHLPNGKAYYEDLTRYYTTLDDATPESIHQLGLEEVKRIRAEMDAVIEQTGFKGSFKEFQELLRTDPQFYPKTEQELLNYAAWLSKDIDGKLPAFFGKLPRQPYSVEPVPKEIAANYTTGRYISAPKNSNRGGQYWVNTYALEKRPLYQMAALTLHEGVPGHHLQGALALEIEDVPEFRTQFYPHAFGEGWGLYAEKLGVEMDVYQTPYDHFGRLSYEMWRACRLVIDTGLHSKGWTRQQAMDYLAANTALSLHNVQTEVDRYISWPGQALAYKIGELTIWRLRRKAEKELGKNFDIRRFHDAILTAGGLPMELLQKRIENFIAGEKQRN